MHQERNITVLPSMNMTTYQLILTEERK